MNQPSDTMKCESCENEFDWSILGYNADRDDDMCPFCGSQNVYFLDEKEATDD